MLKVHQIKFSMINLRRIEDFVTNQKQPIGFDDCIKVYEENGYNKEHFLNINVNFHRKSFLNGLQHSIMLVKLNNFNTNGVTIIIQNSTSLIQIMA